MRGGSPRRPGGDRARETEAPGAPTFSAGDGVRRSPRAGAPRRSVDGYSRSVWEGGGGARARPEAPRRATSRYFADLQHLADLGLCGCHVESPCSALELGAEPRLRAHLGRARALGGALKPHRAPGSLLLRGRDRPCCRGTRRPWRGAWLLTRPAEMNLAASDDRLTPGAHRCAGLPLSRRIGRRSVGSSRAYVGSLRYDG